MKDMEYISMERAAEIGEKVGLLREPLLFHSWKALCNAAIADYLNGAVDGVELPEVKDPWPSYQRQDDYIKGYARQAIAPYAARLKQAEDVLRMAREALQEAEAFIEVEEGDASAQCHAIAAINQQLGEK